MKYNEITLIFPLIPTPANFFLCIPPFVCIPPTSLVLVGEAHGRRTASVSHSDSRINSTSSNNSHIFFSQPRQLSASVNSNSKDISYWLSSLQALLTSRWVHPSGVFIVRDRCGVRIPRGSSTVHLHSLRETPEADVVQND